MSTLIGGFAVWGTVGWLLDQWWGTRFATPVGVILGMVLGIYAVVARFGLAAAPVKQQAGQPQASTTVDAVEGAVEDDVLNKPSDRSPEADTRKETSCQR